MRGNVPNYEMVQARDLAHALALLRDEPGVWRPFAGGTDLMVVYEMGKLAHRKYVSLWGLQDLRKIEITATSATIGALSTYSDIASHAELARDWPMLAQAARLTGAIAIQNRGTIGGNIGNASPAADTPPALLAYGAEVELVSAERGARWVPYETFHTGYKKTVMAADELISRVRVARPPRGSVQYYHKVGARKAQAISKVCFAGLARVEIGKITEIRMAFGSVGPAAVRATQAEAVALSGSMPAAAVSAAVRAQLRPLDDIRSTAEYRSVVAGNLAEEFIRRCGTGSPNFKS